MAMNKENLKEFQSFLANGLEPAREVDNRLLERMKQELNPSLPKSVGKLFICNALGSSLTLFLCPQYGLSLTNMQGVMPWLMNVHPALCFFVCGLPWMMGGQILANLFLSWDERRVLSRYYWGTGFSFILFSVLAFACLGSLTFDGWLVAWGLGALAVSSAFAIRIRLRVNRALLAARVVGI